MSTILAVFSFPFFFLAFIFIVIGIFGTITVSGRVVYGSEAFPYRVTCVAIGIVSLVIAYLMV